ncbi:beta strand repeat-containing protein [Diaphorobacter caeni]|uniref:beta strand repeat-containing protein n=1 Tax=Diaphorobacter caeni TaxID=2784387 RepID=UPI001890147F|nr:DUF11 domain-containing protein [Diaphorobacter caeni]MBF5004434.1 DUF11 domain-containing protein [Diaphorobacter caeni]
MALVGVAALSAHAVDNVTAVWGSFSNNAWTSTTTTASTAVAANGVNNLLAFTAGGTRYSTGVNDAVLTGPFVAAGFQSFTPSANAVPATGGLNGIPLSATYDTTKTRASYLFDGANGLDLNTALFNIPSAPLKFDATIVNAVATTDTVPDVLVTQVGQPSSNLDQFYFVDASNAIVGNSVSVAFNSVAIVGRQSWQFWNPNHTKASVSDGPRDLRIRAYYFSDFGINADNMASVAGFVQRLSGDSDVAFIAYNRQAVSTPAIVSVQKTNGVNMLTAGAATTYTVTLTNSGGSAASGVRWTDTASNLTVTDIAPGTAGTGSNAGACTLSGCTGITLAPGSSIVYTVSANVSGAIGTTATNAAIVDGGDCSNGTPSVCTSTDADPIVSANSVSVTKTNNVSQITTDAQTVYMVTLNNSSAAPFTGLSWSDVPTGLTVNSIALGMLGTGNVGGTCTLSGCTGITLAAGRSNTYYVTATVQASVAAGATVSNRATASGGTCTSASVPGCVSTDTDQVVSPANLNIAKTNGVTLLAQNASTVYTVTLTNTGGTTASGQQWTDTSSGMSVGRIVETDVGPNSSAGLCTTGGCTGITIAPGESIVYSVEATVGSTLGVDAARNTAALVGGTCTNGNVCTAVDADEVVTPANLSIAKSNGVTEITAGAVTIYTVTLQNTGGMAVNNLQWTDSATGVTVTDVAPTFVSTGSSAGTCDVNGCTGVTLAAGGIISYAVTADVDGSAGTRATNTALIDGANCAAGNPAASCTAIDTDDIASPAQLGVVKTNNVTQITAGATTTYTVTLSNSGGTGASGVQWTDNAVGVTVTNIAQASVGANSNAGTCTPAGCSGITLAAGESVAYTVAASVSGAAGGTATNTAAVHGANCASGSPAAECSAVDADTIVTPARVEVTKANGVTQLTAGATTTYTVTLTNSGGTGASGVQWTDNAVGVTVTNIAQASVGANSNAGTCTSAGCSGITLAAGESVAYTVAASVVGSAGTTATNTASLDGGGCTSGSPAAGCSATDQDSIVSPANVSVTKTNGVDQLNVGATTTYTVTLSNLGGTGVSAVEWSDTPTQMTVSGIVASVVGAHSVAGACTQMGCTGITLAAGESIAYLVTASVTGVAGSTASNTASVIDNVACTSTAPCISTDTDTVVAVPVSEVTPVPVDSRLMLGLLGLGVLLLVWRGPQATALTHFRKARRCQRASPF